jgi:hypothetical protein
MVSTLLTVQYTTNPAGKEASKMVNIKGKKAKILA